MSGPRYRRCTGARQAAPWRPPKPRTAHSRNREACPVIPIAARRMRAPARPLPAPPDHQATSDGRAAAGSRRRMPSRALPAARRWAGGGGATSASVLAHRVGAVVGDQVARRRRSGAAPGRTCRCAGRPRSRTPMTVDSDRRGVNSFHGRAAWRERPALSIEPSSLARGLRRSLQAIGSRTTKRAPRDAAALAAPVLGPDAAAVGLDDLLGDAQAQARVGAELLARRPFGVEAVEDVLSLPAGNARSLVENLCRRPSPLRPARRA